MQVSYLFQARVLDLWWEKKKMFPSTARDAAHITGFEHANFTNSLDSQVLYSRGFLF